MREQSRLLFDLLDKVFDIDELILNELYAEGVLNPDTLASLYPFFE